MGLETGIEIAIYLSEVNVIGRIAIVMITVFLLSPLNASDRSSDLQVAQQCLADSQRNPQFIIINKYRKKKGQVPAHFKSHVFDRKKNQWVDEFDSLAGEGGIGCRSSSKKTPPGILEIKAEGSTLGADHWKSDKRGFKKYFMDDIAGNPCDLFAKTKGFKHRSHQRKIRFHSNTRMKNNKVSGEMSKGCFVISPQKFKEWGGGQKVGFPGNAIVYNVAPEGMKIPKIKCRPKNRVLTRK